MLVPRTLFFLSVAILLFTVWFGWETRGRSLAPQPRPDGEQPMLGPTFAPAQSPAITGVAAHQRSISDETATNLAPFTDADFEKRVADLKQRYPDPELVFLIEKPFIVVGNEAPETVKKRASNTVKWAVKRLKSQYFAKDPNQIVVIWLMKDAESYQQRCLEIVKYKPTTPYGFYSPANQVLMMNISTGGGTLVHEIVHPFVEANFPQCPALFNEGLASLYEQSSSNENGKIVGLTNWRLAGLQRAIIDQQVDSFETLCSTTSQEFYGQRSGVRYAQARYLCYYLQQIGKLDTYYQQFCQNVGKDPSGYTTLVQVLDTDEMESFQEDWQSYVLRLRFPGTP